MGRIAPDVSTPSLMALARHRDYRTTRRYVRVDGEHLRAAVERLAGPGCATEGPLVRFPSPAEVLGPEGRP